MNKKSFLTPLLAAALCVGAAGGAQAKAGHYRNFKVSVYVRAYEVDKMKDLQWLDSTWNIISQQLDVDKVYLETHRDLLLVGASTIEQAKNYFHERGVETAGGITYTIDESNNFETFCYSNPQHRQKVQEIAEFTAAHFDEFILDDFFFTSCKSPEEIAAKGNRSWTDYRLQLMTEAGRNLVLGPAKRVNPRVKVIIKYPNWYDHFQGLGFNLEEGPQLFDGIWTGTETRDPAGNQHLQNYLSYNIIRYFDNLCPGYNGGGWVDAGGLEMGMDRYAEQLHLTILAKAPEIILFAYHQLLSVKLSPKQRTPWQDGTTSFRYGDVIAPVRQKDGSTVRPTTMARIADVVLKQTDKLVGQLGNPLGIASYKPFHSSGEDFLQNYLGMAGLPMDMRPYFPDDRKVVLLTSQAAKDPALMENIRTQLQKGGDVVITSGLLKAIPEKIAEIAELRCTDLKALVDDFGRYGRPHRTLLIPQVLYYTNDAWELVSAGRPLTGGVSGYPILLRALYGGGNLYVLTIPDDVGQLYDYPAEALNVIRRICSQDLGVYVEGPSKVCLFVYDNQTVVVENFNDGPADVCLVFNRKGTGKLLNLEEHSTVTPEPATDTEKRKGEASGTRFSVLLPPHSYKAFKVQF